MENYISYVFRTDGKEHIREVTGTYWLDYMIETLVSILCIFTVVFAVVSLLCMIVSVILIPQMISNFGESPEFYIGAIVLGIPAFLMMVWQLTTKTRREYSEKKDRYEQRRKNS